MSDKDINQNRYFHVTEMVRYHNDKMIAAFIRFISLMTSIVGGFFFLVSQDNIKIEFKEFTVLVLPYLISFIAISTLFIIWSNWFSWYGFRKAETKIIDDPDVPPPKFPRACKEQIIVTLIILITASVSFLLTHYLSRVL